VETDSSGLCPREYAPAAAEPGSARWWAERAEADARRRPRAGGLTAARIIDAALEVLREGGLGALTVRAVADRLGTSSASLYRHIASREELLALIVDHVLGDIRLDTTGRGWRADVEALMRELRRVILEQPLPASAARSRTTYGPNMMRLVDAALGLFLRAGLSDERAAYATITMIEFVAGSATIQRSALGRTPWGAAGSDGFDRLLDGLPADRLPALRAAGAAFVTASVDEVFTHGMAVFLDGVTRQLPGEREREREREREGVRERDREGVREREQGQ
jgi:AcrR family transcriptional regulator